VPQEESVSANLVEDSGFSGFVAVYENGESVHERENYYSSTLRRKMATNWLEIDKDKIVTLELFYRGKKMVSIKKSEHPEILPADWFFSHTGCLDMATHEVKVVARSIGYRTGQVTNVVSVFEADGTMKGSTRAQ
jgi:hypothetical protein